MLEYAATHLGQHNLEHSVSRRGNGHDNALTHRVRKTAENESRRRL